MDWENVPDVIASKVSQLPNKMRQKVGAKLKGPSAAAYSLPSEIEDEMMRL